jgi:hypothetical protein
MVYEIQKLGLKVMDALYCSFNKTLLLVSCLILWLLKKVQQKKVVLCCISSALWFTIVTFQVLLKFIIVGFFV